MLGKKLINAGPVSSGANTFASENFNTVLYTGNGSTQRIGGYINRGAVFNGSSSNIVAAVPNSIIDTIDSVSFWFNVNSLSSVNSLLNIGNLTSNGSPLRFRVVPTGSTPSQKLRLIVHNSSNTVENVYSTTTISTNTWYHVAAVWTGSQWKMYINGVNEANSSSTTSRVSSAGNEIYIGENDALYNPLNGKIDQVRIFNKALSSSEVTTLYGETHASTTISTTDIFSDNSGVALYQLDGNANDTGGASGKFGSAAIFNGSSYISTSLDLDTYDETWSISMWVKFDFNSSYRFIAGTVSATTALNGFVIDIGTSGEIRFRLRNNTTSVSSLESSSTYGDGDWHHIVAVKGATTNYLYIDGNSESLSTSTTNGINHTSGFTFGRMGNYAGYFLGSIDDVRVYDDEITASEALNIYNNTSIPTDNLVAYYKLDGDARDEQQLYDGTATNVTYAYDGTATNVTYQEATNFQPDLVWIKERTSTSNHTIIDVVRGTNSQLYTNLNNVATTSNFTSFDSNGFTLGTDNGINENSQDYVAWCFKSGGTAVSNTDGSITSSVSANQNAGFSIVTWTSDGSTGLEVGHGLAQQPELIINKRYSGSTSNWNVYTDVIDGSWDFLRLNTTDAKSDSADTQASSSLIRNTSTAGSFVAYCFHSVDGYSKVGTYTGTGAAGNTVVTGFEPSWIMIKVTNDTASWAIFDNKRGGNLMLRADTSSADADGNNSVSFTSNGFTLPETGLTTNTSGKNYIYLAIAADPDTTTPIVENSFDVVTYEGDGTTNHQIDVDFKPDMVFGKNRGSTGENWFLIDSIRENGGRILYTNLTNAQSSSGYFTLNNDGFTIDTTNNNISGNDYVAFAFKAGDHDDNLPQINTEGSIDSTVSVNAAAGFSIVKTSSTAGAITFGHGLSQTPELIINKGLTTNGWSWLVYHKDVGTGKYLKLNSSDAVITNAGSFSSVTSTTITNNSSNSTSDYINYCFHSVSGYQKIGSYSGNSTSGTLINTGFQPRFVLIKTTNATSNWFILDAVRGGTQDLRPNSSNAEETRTNGVTFVSNGFEIDDTSVGFNSSGTNYIYLAIK